jgi:hypothetical protein
VEDLQAQILFCFPIQVIQAAGSRTADLEPIKDMVSALQNEVASDRASLLEALIATLRGVQLRLQMSIRDEEKTKVLYSRR